MLYVEKDSIMIVVKECVFIDENGVRISYDELIALKEKSSTKHTHPIYWE